MFDERRKNVCLTALRKAFVKRLKSLTANSLREGVSAFTEHAQKNVASELQNFHETLYTAFDKCSENIQIQWRYVSVLTKFENV